MATKRKDGRLQTSVTIENPSTGEKKRVFIYGYDERELAREKKRILKEAEAGRMAFTSDTLSSYATLCLKSKLSEGRINESSFLVEQSVLKNHILPNLPHNVKLADIKPVHVKTMLSRIRTVPTKRSAFALLKSIYREAVFEGLLTLNPCDLVRSPRVETQHAAIISPAQCQQILEEVRGTMWQFVFVLLLETGIRRGELCALRWNKLNGNILTIDASIKPSTSGFIEGGTKTVSSTRTIPISESTVKLMAEWKTQLRKSLMARNLPFEYDSYIFRAPKDPARVLSPSSVSNKMRNLKRKLGLPDRFCTHSTRHTHATLLAASDLNPKKIQNRLGHASAAFTLNTYVHNTDMDSGVLEVVKAIELKYNLH